MPPSVAAGAQRRRRRGTGNTRQRDAAREQAEMALPGGELSSAELAVALSSCGVTVLAVDSEVRAEATGGRRAALLARRLPRAPKRNTPPVFKGFG